MTDIDMQKLAKNMVGRAQSAIAKDDKSLDEIRDMVKKIQDDPSQDNIIETVTKAAVGFFCMGVMQILTGQYREEELKDE